MPGDGFSQGAEGQHVVRYARSHALLIGVSGYTAGWPDLPSVPGELEQVRVALEQHGFVTEKVLDPGEDVLRKAIEDFIERTDTSLATVSSSSSRVTVTAGRTERRATWCPPTRRARAPAIPKPSCSRRCR